MAAARRSAAPRRRPPATLVLRVDGAFALEAQHAAAIIVERVNAHLGWRCVGKVAFRQGPLLELKPKRRAAPAPSASAQAEAAALAAPIDDEGLRQAFTKLARGRSTAPGGRDRGSVVIASVSEAIRMLRLRGLLRRLRSSQ